MRVEGAIVIDRAIEEVFDYVADERNEPAYNPRMTRAEKLSAGPVGVGTTFSATMTRAGRRFDVTIEFTEFDRPHRIVERAALSDMDIRGQLLFDTVPAGTRMRWVWDLAPRGLYRLLGPLVRVIGERQERSIWTELKRVLEAQPRAPAAPA